jgi:hypothetical protein
MSWSSPCHGVLVKPVIAYVTSVHYRGHNSPTGTYPEPFACSPRSPAASLGRQTLRDNLRAEGCTVLSRARSDNRPSTFARNWQCVFVEVFSLVIHATCSAHPILLVLVTVIISGAAIMKLRLNFMSLFLLDKQLLYVTYAVLEPDIPSCTPYVVTGRIMIFYSLGSGSRE